MPEPHATPSEQARAIEKAAGLRLRDDLALVQVRGDDRQTWLNGQVTSDVRGMKPRTSLYALAVNVRGKIIADLRIAEAQDHLLVLVPKSARSALLESFERFIIMEDVTLVPETDARVISVQGPRAEQVLALDADAQARAFACDEIGVGGYFVRTDAEHAPPLLRELLTRSATLGALGVDEAGFELARLRRASPRFGNDFDDTSYPQEAGLKHALSFNKGCYLGQEVVCTLENRGRLSRQLCALRVMSGQQPAPGDEVQSEAAEPSGRITSVVFDPDQGLALALGYVKRTHALVGATLRSGTSQLCVTQLVGESEPLAK